MHIQFPASYPIGIIPTLYMADLAAALDFYKAAFDAVELWRVPNADGTVHVAEMTINGAYCRLHEAMKGNDKKISPAAANGTTVVIGLLVADAHAVANRAIAAGAEVVEPVTDYEYGYRQGTLKDPFGHYWQIEFRERI